MKFTVKSRGLSPALKKMMKDYEKMSVASRSVCIGGGSCPMCKRFFEQKKGK